MYANNKTLNKKLNKNIYKIPFIFNGWLSLISSSKGG